MKIIAVTSTVLGVALTTFFLIRFAEFKANCVESQLLEAVYFRNQQRGLLFCSQSFWRDPFRVFQQLDKIQENKQWQEMIEQTERITNYLSKPQRKFSIIVNHDLPEIYQIHTNVVEVGENWLERPEAIQRLILLFWLKKNSREKYYFSHEIVADFLLSLIHNKFFVVGAEANREEEEINWTDLTVHPSFYCQTPWRLVQEKVKCDVGNGGIVLNLRPLIARVLWEAYGGLTFREQRKFWSWLENRLTDKRGFILVAALNDRHLTPVDRLSQGLNFLAKQFYPDQYERQEWVARTKVKLRLQDAEHPQIIVQVEPGVRIKAPQSFLINDQILTWVRRDGRREPLLSPPGLPKKKLFIYCKRRVLMSEVVNQASEEVLIFKSCEAEKITDWQWALQGDFLTFISNHRDNAFLWLRSQGLTALIKLRGNKITTEEVGLKRLRVWSYWLEDSWDRAAAAFRPRAAIDVVFAHRAAKELL